MHRQSWQTFQRTYEEDDRSRNRARYAADSRGRSPVRYDDSSSGRLRGASCAVGSSSGRRRSQSPPRREFRPREVSPPRRVDETCKEFLQGRCTRGTRCRYSHGSADMSTALMLQSQLLAQMLFPVAASRGPPACRHYAAGKCTRVPCKFSHAPSAAAITPNMMAGLQQMAQLQQAMSKQAQLPPPCRDFNAGHCTRGSTCQFSHLGQPSLMHERPRPVKQCSDFARGSCTRQGCRFAHVTRGSVDTVCRNFLAGNCDRGNSCRFSHNAEALEPAPLEPCRDFTTGRCNREHCRFAHPAGTKRGRQEEEGEDGRNKKSSRADNRENSRERSAERSSTYQRSPHSPERSRSGGASPAHSPQRANEEQQEWGNTR